MSEDINAGTESAIDFVALYRVQRFYLFPKNHLDHINHGTKNISWRQLLLR